jgi:hypothetical protein
MKGSSERQKKQRLKFSRLRHAAWKISIVVFKAVAFPGWHSGDGSAFQTRFKSPAHDANLNHGGCDVKQSPRNLGSFRTRRWIADVLVDASPCRYHCGSQRAILAVFRRSRSHRCSTAI